MTNEKTLLKRILGIIAFDQTYIELAFPIFTLIFFDTSSRLLPADTSYAIRAFWFGTCISTPYFINIFFAPLLSSMSDEFGRRKFLLFEISSSVVYMSLAALGVLFGHLWLLILGIVLRGAFSRTNTTALSIIGDLSQGSQKLKYMSYMQVAIALGASIGPILAGLLAKRFYFNYFNFSIPFFVGACFALINWFLVYHFMPETLKQSVSQALKDSTSSRLRANLLAVKYVITHKDVLMISLLLITFQLSWSTYYQFMSPLLKTVYQFNPETLGLFIGLVAFWIAVGAGPVFKMVSPRMGYQQILNFSVILEVFGISLVTGVYYHWLPETVLWLSPIPTAIGDVLAYICITTLYSNSVAKHMQGKVMGINFLIVGLIWGGTAFLGGLLIAHSPILPIVLAPLGAITTYLIVNYSACKKMVLSYSN